MALDVTEPMPNVVRMALLLPGWDRYSVWGWDATGGHVFARLWGNADDPDMPPTIRIRHGGPEGWCHLAKRRRAKRSLISDVRGLTRVAAGGMQGVCGMRKAAG